MSDQVPNSFETADTAQRTPASTGRRGFFKKMAGAGGVAAVVASGCDTIFDTNPGGKPGETVTLDFSTDFGVLNYAYALEQLEAAFYAQVVGSLDSGELSFGGGSGGDQSTKHYFENIAKHEAIHRDFLGAAIPANGGEAIPALEVDFSSVDFSDPMSVLGTAKALEDTGVSAYNGAAHMLSNATFLTLAGKIVSVEARHAAAVRAILDPKSKNFADLSEIGRGADPEAGYDAAQSPDDVLAAADPFIATPLATENVDMMM